MYWFNYTFRRFLGYYREILINPISTILLNLENEKLISFYDLSRAPFKHSETLAKVVSFRSSAIYMAIVFLLNGNMREDWRN